MCAWELMDDDADDRFVPDDDDDDGYAVAAAVSNRSQTLSTKVLRYRDICLILSLFFWHSICAGRTSAEIHDLSPFVVVLPFVSSYLWILLENNSIYVYVFMCMHVCVFIGKEQRSDWNEPAMKTISGTRHKNKKGNGKRQYSLLLFVLLHTYIHYIHWHSHDCFTCACVL